MYRIKDIDDYMGKITEEQAEELINHCNELEIRPEICAWYDDKEDFYQGWIYDNRIFDNKSDADTRYNDGVEIGEFIRFANGEIVRLVI